MGEEEKKPAEEKKAEEKAAAAPPEEAKKPAEEKTDNAEKKPPAGEEEKKKEGGGEGEKKADETAPADGKDGNKDAAPAAPPEIVLRVYMHCEGCARKVKKCLRGFNGVEDVITDCKNHTVVVKGEKADPVKVLERVQRKSHRHVELLSPLPKPPAEEGEGEKKAEEKEAPKEEEKKPEEPKVISVVLKVHMHCEACAQEIKKRIERMKEVESATPDLKASEVTVKGTFDPAKLVDYVYKRTGKQAVIVKQDPEPEKKEEGGEGGKEEKPKEGGEGGGGDGEKKEGGEDKKEGEEKNETPVETVEDLERKVVEMRRNEYMYNMMNYPHPPPPPPRYAMEMYHHAYPPQIFSDENPNACSVM